MSISWSTDQDTMLRKHTDWSDEDMAVALSLIGPSRTATAVLTRRSLFGIPYTPKQGRGIEAQRARMDRRDGWPKMVGEEDERDALYVESLKAAQHEALALCRCPKCVACVWWPSTIDPLFSGAKALASAEHA